VPATPIPTWKERLAACFRWRHRFLHVFGAPAAVGALTAMGTASLLNADTGMSLGALVTALGSVIAGYYVTAGFDKKLVEQLQAEGVEQGVLASAKQLEQILWNADPEIRPIFERILAVHGSIEAVFTDGIDDDVERILDGSRADLRALRDRAAKMVELYRRLGDVVQQSDGRRLYEEMNRLKEEVARLPEGGARRAREEASISAERTYSQWHAAYERRGQITSVLTVIEKNLEEFKLAMALRKADAAEGAESTTNVSELQERLAAAGQACDELVGRTPSTTDARHSRRPRRSRA
jgi:hypothetical protein